MTGDCGIIQLHAGIDPVVDVVALHGLYGDALKTWTTKGSEQCCWLNDPKMLPDKLPRARILSWGYNADVTALLGDTSSDRILHHAHTLVAQLQADREVLLPTMVP